MRKTLLLFFITLAIKNYGQDISYGIKGGLNVSQITTNKRGSRMAYHFGVLSEVEINETLSIQPELLYSAQGYKNQFAVNNTIRTYKFDYLSVPVILKYYLTEKVNLQVGPQFSFKIKAEEEYKSKNTPTTARKIENIRAFDLAMGTGLAYKLESNINLSLRYTLGITDIFKVRNITTTRNGVLQISVGYFF